MVFSSASFIFLFLPSALALVLTTRRWVFLPAIFAISFLFYFWSAGPRGLQRLSSLLEELTDLRKRYGVQLLTLRQWSERRTTSERRAA